MQFYNTLTQKKEIFEPEDGKTATLYHCGPTVYHYAHLGNLRAFIFADILRRALETRGWPTEQVINITDVGHLTSDADTGEDKLEEGARREGKTAREIADFYTESFFADLEKLNIKTPHHFPRASAHINEQITLIQKLETAGYTYQISDGIYFDTSKYPSYHELAALDLEHQFSTERVNTSEKRHEADFALWKFSPKDQKRQQEWDSPWGLGFPGWHIECSAMAIKYLGETIDIHTGGIDHVPVHHTNERAQSECATGERFVNFWMHSEFVDFEGEKMAKSEGNIIRLKSLEEHGISPLAYRYWLLSAHYRRPISFNWQALEGAQKALDRLHEAATDLPEPSMPNTNYEQKFQVSIDDDLSTPEALALMWQLLKDDEVEAASKKATLLEFDKILGLDLENAEHYTNANLTIDELPDNIQELIKARESARAQKDWPEADRLRDELLSLGYHVDDQPDGPKITTKTKA